MKRYRYVTPTRKGRWYPTREQAQDAAAEMRLGHRDPYSGRFYADVFTSIEVCELVEVAPIGAVTAATTPAARRSRRPAS